MGELLGKFELLGHIATGGMAEIHMACQRGLQGFSKLVVIKRLLPSLAKDPEVVELFLNEARIAAKLNHSNVIQIYDLGRAQDSYYIAMEYIQGENLRMILKRCAEQRRLLPLPHALQIIKRVSEGLHYAHSKTDAMSRPLNIVHCDISPQNIVISFDGLVKIVDFGIARAAATLEQSAPGRVRGKYGYMSPEQCTGKALDARSDIFSFGIVFWELCTSRRLFRRASPLETAKAILAGEVTSVRHYNSQISPELDAIIMRALQVNPDRRYQSVLQMGMAVDQEMKRLGLDSSTLQLGAFMRQVFSDKLANLKRIEEAQEKGEKFNQEWFVADKGSDTSSPELDIPGPPPASTEASWIMGPESSSGPISTGGLRIARNYSHPHGKPNQVRVHGQSFRLNKRRKTFGGLWLVMFFVVLGGLVLFLGFGADYLPQFQALVQDVKGWLGTQEMRQQAQAQPAQKPITPNQDEQARLAEVKIRSTPAGAEVYLDDVIRCNTPCQIADLQASKAYHVRLSLVGFEEFVKRIEPAFQKPLVLEVRLQRITPKSFGQLLVLTKPEGAVVELDGKLLAEMTPVTIRRIVANRKHTIRAWIEPRQVWVTKFRLRPGEYKTIRGVLPDVTAIGSAQSYDPNIVLQDENLDDAQNAQDAQNVLTNEETLDLEDPDDLVGPDPL